MFVHEHEEPATITAAVSKLVIAKAKRIEDPYNEMDPALNATLNAIIHAIQQQQIESGRMQDVLADVVNRVTAPAPVNAVRLPEMLEKAVVFDGKREEDFQECFEAITNAGWTVDQKKRVAIGSLRGVAAQWQDEVGVNSVRYDDCVQTL